MPSFGGLEDFPLFAGIPEEDLRSFRTLFEERTFRKKEHLFASDQALDSIYFVKHGRVKISYFSEDGKEFTVTILKPGEVYSQHSEAVAAALEETSVLVIRMEGFKKILHARPQIAARLINVLGRILRMQNDVIQNLAFREVSSRLAHFLIDQCLATGVLLHDGCSFKLGLTHEELATMLGSSRQTITSTLNRFEKNNFIAIHKKQITILNFERLQELAG